MMLTRKERVLRTLHFEPVDRVPVVGGFVRHPRFLADAAARISDHFRGRAVPVQISLLQAAPVL